MTLTVRLREQKLNRLCFVKHQIANDPDSLVHQVADHVLDQCIADRAPDHRDRRAILFTDIEPHDLIHFRDPDLPKRRIEVSPAVAVEPKVIGTVHVLFDAIGEFWLHKQNRDLDQDLAQSHRIDERLDSIEVRIEVVERDFPFGKLLGELFEFFFWFHWLAFT